MRSLRKHSQVTPGVVTVGVSLLLAACGGQPVTYTGGLVPIAGTCDPAGSAVLTTRGHYVQFTPRQGVLILPGQADPGGVVTAALDTPGADRKPYHLAFHGKLAGDDIAGEYVTPRCRYRANLHRAD